MVDANVTQDAFEVKLKVGERIVVIAFLAAATALIYATLKRANDRF